MAEVVVAAGQPTAVEVAGAGADMLQGTLLHLGQRVAPLDLLLKDELGACAFNLSAQSRATFWHPVASPAIIAVGRTVVTR